MQQFREGEGGGGGANLGYLKNMWGAQLQAVSGGTLEDNIKKIVW